MTLKQRNSWNTPQKSTSAQSHTVIHIYEVTESEIVSFYTHSACLSSSKIQKKAQIIFWWSFFYANYSTQCVNAWRKSSDICRRFIWLRIKRVNWNGTYPFLCGLKLIGVRDVDCSASLCCLSSATLSLVTICSSICIFNMFLAVVFALLHEFRTQLARCQICVVYQASKPKSIEFLFLLVRFGFRLTITLLCNIDTKGYNFKCKHH